MVACLLRFIKSVERPVKVVIKFKKDHETERCFADLAVAEQEI